MTIDERLKAIRESLVDADVNPDSVSLALYYAKEKINDGWHYAGMMQIPVRAKGKLIRWTTQVCLWREDASGQVEDIHRDF